ncbi:carbonate dehydratase [Camillea tinctor]|nr:carbonate dehydratase [Camillea tinctor]
MATEIQKNFKEKNAQYASQFTQGHLALPPAKKYLIVTCMDARIDPSAAFGVDLGDAHIIRNAGASARDALRSVLVSQLLLGTREVLLVKHTGCGMLTFSNADARSLLAQSRGAAALDAVRDLDFLPFGDLDDAVREDVRFLKEGELADRGIAVTGWVYDVQTGGVRQVV